MKHSSFIVLALCVIATGQISCSSTSYRVKRIEANTDLYKGLTDEDRTLVDQGRIREGMHKEAVFLSWGRPNGVRKGSKTGVPYEVWTYTASQPQIDQHFMLGYGWGPGYSRRHPYYDPYFLYSPTFSTGSRIIETGRVEFLNDRVEAWETRRR